MNAAALPASSRPAAARSPCSQGRVPAAPSMSPAALHPSLPLPLLRRPSASPVACAASSAPLPPLGYPARSFTLHGASNLAIEVQPDEAHVASYLVEIVTAEYKKAIDDHGYFTLAVPGG
jgi:hypothetical protein